MASFQFVNNQNIHQQDYQNNQTECSNNLQNSYSDLVSTVNNNNSNNSQFAIIVYNDNEYANYGYTSSNSNSSNNSNIIKKENETNKSDLLTLNNATIVSKTEPCRVCGEVGSTGLHYGTIICEACKKFFLRNANSNDEQLKCVRNNSRCVVTRVTRTNCAFCRLKKCLSLGMTLNDKKEIQSFKDIKCQVCSASSSGLHFGAITCEGCKGFFRRTVSQNLQLQCSANGNCEINADTRNICRACRYNRCLKIGMDLKNCRVGRQSNLFKKTLFSSNDAPTQTVNTEQIIVHNEFENAFSPDERNIINNVCESYIQSIECSLSEDNLSSLDSVECIKYVLNNLEKHALASLRFINNLTFLQQLSNLEQRILIINSIHSIRYIKINKSNKHTNYLYIDDNSYSIMSKLFPVFVKSDNHFKYLHDKFIKNLNMDIKEFSLYTLLVILTGTFVLGEIREESLKLISKYKHEVLYCLSKYMKARRNETESFLTIFSLIQHYRRINCDLKASLYTQLSQLNTQLIQFKPNIQTFYLTLENNFSNNNAVYFED